MFDWILDYIARHSPDFKAQAQTIERLTNSSNLRAIVESEEERKMLKHERDEALIDLESTKTEMMELRGTLAVSIPIQAVGNMIESSQYAGLFINSDDFVIFSNPHADRYFGKPLTGKNLGEAIPQKTVAILDEWMKKERIGFKFNVKDNPLYGWYIGLAKDHNDFYGALLTYERGFVEKFFRMFSPLRNRTKQPRESGVIVPETIPIKP